MDSKGATFVILKNHVSAPIRMERLSPASKARRETSQNEFVKKAEHQTRWVALEKLIAVRIV